MSSHQLAAEAYRIMWLFVFFDLPVTTKPERKQAFRFRKDLLDDGFSMMQYSVYIRHCASKESAEVHTNRVKDWVPPSGLVSILSATDKQFGQIINIQGEKAKPPPSTPAQLEFF
ncbi:MAG: CRISPR-associated endonuclease Cas2 [bacterium]